jgi:hypothetical protein
MRRPERLVTGPDEPDAAPARVIATDGPMPVQIAVDAAAPAPYHRH